MPRGERIGLAVGLLTLVFAPSAHATGVTLGYTGEFHETHSEFICMGAPFGCSSGITVKQKSPLTVSPAAGVVTDWEMYGGGPVALRTLAPAGGEQWKGTGTSAIATDVKGGLNRAEVPIEAGGTIGADLGIGGALFIDETNAAAFSSTFNPPIGEDETRTTSGDSSGEVELRATVELTPIVTSVAPSSGSTAGGNTVTITGKYFDNAVNVAFGKVAAAHFTVAPDGEHITATAPASAAGTVDVLVSEPHTTSEPVAADRYTFIAPPGGSGSGAGGPGGGPGPGGPGQGGAAALTASGFHQSASRWRLGNALPHIASTPVGTMFSFSLNTAGNVSLAFSHSLPGRRVGGRCVAASARNQSRPRCKRTVGVATLSFAGHSGVNTIRFQGRVSRTKRLSPGPYSVRLTTRDALGTKPLSNPLGFTIVR